MAEQLGVAGWVRNLPSGDVEAVFEGSSETVAGAVAWCRKGPEHAVVTALHEVDEEPEGLEGFSVR
jgi:acylphosphatase